MKKQLRYFLLGAILLMAVGCRDRLGREDAQSNELYYANMFGANVMRSYYLWNEEVSDGIASWSYDDDPIAKVNEIRYKDDRWSMMTDDIDSFMDSVNGTGKTFGFDFELYMGSEERVIMVITFTYPDSPARKAGMKRGDVIIGLNGRLMTLDNYATVITEALEGDQLLLSCQSGGAYNLTAVVMYEDPILLCTSFEHAGRKVGYLHFTSFTAQAALDLPKAVRPLKDAGVQDLVLDLRYNGGGYVLTEQVLATLLAPEEAVLSGQLFSTEVYNKEITVEVGNDPVYFSTKIDVSMTDEPQMVDVSGDILSPEHIYALVSPYTASASESVIGCLAPYVDITVIGEQTHGKFCSGIILPAQSWYQTLGSQLSAAEVKRALSAVPNWGIYVMISRFADKNGFTLCAPKGILPDYKAEDTIKSGVELGDPQEPMLATALKLIAGEQPQQRPAARPGEVPVRLSKPGPERPGRFRFHLN